MKTLIIEDDTAIANMYKTQFELMGHEVALAENGQVGLVCVDKLLPDLILLDIIMPVMDGFEVLARLNIHPRRQQFKIFVLSNLSQDDDIQRGMMLGADDYFTKLNFTPTQLGDKIK